MNNLDLKIPSLISQRLILRPFKLSDAKEVQRQAGSSKIASTTGAVPHPYLDGMAEDWISKHHEWFKEGLAVNWAIVLKESDNIVGSISFGLNQIHNRAELGYWVGEEFWNKGYCSEAAVEAIRYGFKELALNKITSRHMSENPSSGKVMQKAGMTKEGYLKQDVSRNGKFVDLVIYGLLREEFQI